MGYAPAGPTLLRYTPLGLTSISAFSTLMIRDLHSPQTSISCIPLYMNLTPFFGYSGVGKTGTHITLLGPLGPASSNSFLSAKGIYLNYTEIKQTPIFCSIFVVYLPLCVYTTRFGTTFRPFHGTLWQGGSQRIDIGGHK